MNTIEKAKLRAGAKGVILVIAACVVGYAAWGWLGVIVMFIFVNTVGVWIVDAHDRWRTERWINAHEPTEEDHKRSVEREERARSERLEVERDAEQAWRAAVMEEHRRVLARRASRRH